MRLRSSLAALAAVPAAFAFRDTSPFFLFSTSSLPTSTSVYSESNLVAAHSLSQYVPAMLRDCPSDVYILVNQPGVRASDFNNQGNTPHLQRRVGGQDKAIKSQQVISDILGGNELSQLWTNVADQCNARSASIKQPELPPADDRQYPHILKIDLSPLPSKPADRAAALTNNDAYLNTIITDLATQKYTVIYTTTPPSTHAEYESAHTGQQEQMYEMDDQYPSSVHADHFKRDTTAYPRAANGSTELNEGVPLFEKYEFLSPGIFMGGIVALLLIAILMVGINAVASLEVSYAAFNKENGPAAQRKGQ